MCQYTRHGHEAIHVRNDILTSSDSLACNFSCNCGWCTRVLDMIARFAIVFVVADGFMTMLPLNRTREMF